MSKLIILFGAPGSGKGTQAKKITEKLGFIHISTGDILRREVQNKSNLGKEIENIIISGKLVNDDLIQKLIVKNINFDKNYILDGFPRNLKQAEFLDRFIFENKEKELEIRKVLYLNLPEAEIIKRILGRRICSNCKKEYNVLLHKIDNNNCLLCNSQLEIRKDDNEKAIKKRIDVYFKETSLLIDYYKQKNLLLDIDANDTIENISSYIFANIGKI
ncbi:MAG: nucleoside monophosphate kinase [Elusimicrobiota bacterium]|jgi:adenylate kinase|nr:nucleoside monophosphate kinase [Elusimicrobiota bacterium]